MLRIVQNLRRRALFDDDAGVHEDDGVGDLPGEADFVRDDDQGPPLFRQQLNGVENFADQLGVKCRSRFVEQDDGRSQGQGPAIATRCCWPPES